MITISQTVRRQGVAAARLMRLDRPHDLLFLLFFGLWATWVANGGRPHAWNTIVFLFGAAALRCAAWVFADSGAVRWLPGATGPEVRQSPLDQMEALRLFAVLCGIGFIAAVYLHPYAVLAAPVVLALVIAYPWLRARTYLSTVALTSAFACAAPMAWFAQGLLPGKVAWLIYLTGVFWGLAFLLLEECGRAQELARDGMRSLALLAGDLLPLSIGLLLIAALTAAGLAGHHAGFGTLFELGWLGAAVAAVFQVGLLLRPYPGVLERAYSVNSWFAFSLWVGTLAHYVCALSASNA